MHSPERTQGAARRALVRPGVGPFNTAMALYANVKELPAYLDTPTEVTTDSLYWNNRLVAGLSDPQFFESYEAIQGYRLEHHGPGLPVAARDRRRALRSSPPRARRTWTIWTTRR